MAAAKSKGGGQSGKGSVDDFLDALSHPLKEAIREVRRTVLEAAPGLEEGIKWNAPSFRYAGEDRITFNLRGEAQFRLIFHCGVKPRANDGRQLIADESGLLEWAAPDRAVMTFGGDADAIEKAPALRKIVADWLAAPLGAH